MVYKYSRIGNLVLFWSQMKNNPKSTININITEKTEQYNDKDVDVNKVKSEKRQNAKEAGRHIRND